MVQLIIVELPLEVVDMEENIMVLLVGLELQGKVLLEVSPLHRGRVFRMEAAAAVHQRLAQTTKAQLATGRGPILSREVLGVQV